MLTQFFEGPTPGKIVLKNCLENSPLSGNSGQEMKKRDENGVE